MLWGVCTGGTAKGEATIAAPASSDATSSSWSSRRYRGTADTHCERASTVSERAATPIGSCRTGLHLCGRQLCGHASACCVPWRPAAKKSMDRERCGASGLATGE